MRTLGEGSTSLQLCSKDGDFDVEIAFMVKFLLAALTLPALRLVYTLGITTLVDAPLLLYAIVGACVRKFGLQAGSVGVMTRRSDGESLQGGDRVCVRSPSHRRMTVVSPVTIISHGHFRTSALLTEVS